MFLAYNIAKRSCYERLCTALQNFFINLLLYNIRDKVLGFLVEQYNV